MLRLEEEIMNTRRLALHLATSALWLLLISNWAVPARGGLMLTFSGTNLTTILDTDAGQSPGAITFNLLTDQNYAVSGTLTSQTTATSFSATLTLQANFVGPEEEGLTVNFFAAGGPPPVAPVVATDSLSAAFSNIYGSNTIGAGNTLVEQAFVNATEIQPVMSNGFEGAVDFSPGAGIPGGIKDGHGPTLIPMDGPPWDLFGTLSFSLDERDGAGEPGDSLTYTDTILISTVAEPSVLTHVASGGLLGLTIWHWRRRKSRA
jgi:hypothetical protein